MLNIPVDVQNLFKADSIRKDFRVHFPNGELADFNAANVVEESVRFTESLCSQQYLKFGLTEASEIEFETVGIGNMMGFTIQCACEIDISSLGAAWIAGQLSNTDAVLAADDSNALQADASSVIEVSTTMPQGLTWLDPQITYWDDGTPAYRVPYGEFIVDSCPRNHGAMTHRRITAYSKANIRNGNGKLSAWQKMYNDSGFKKPTLSFDIGRMITAAIPEAAATLTYTDSTSSETYANYFEDVIGSGSQYEMLYLGADTSSASLPQRGTENADEYDIGFSSGKIIHIHVEYSSEYYAMKEYIKTLADTYNITNFGTVNYCLPNIRIIGGKIYEFTDTDAYIYAFGANTITFSWIVSNYIWIYVHDWLTPGMPVVASRQFGKLFNSIKIEYTTGTAYPQIIELIEPESSIKRSNGTFNFYDIDFEQFAEGAFEVYGEFSQESRTGGLTSKKLDNSSPYSILPSVYSSCWWDEYDVEPIGTIRYTFENEEVEDAQTIDYEFGDGSSYYDMSDNYAIQYLKDASETAVNNLLDTYFIPNISAVNFTPIDLEMKGLPYLEAGDYLTVTAEDGTTVSSFILRHTISGIQSLSQTIESTNGELLDAEDMEDGS